MPIRLARPHAILAVFAAAMLLGALPAGAQPAVRVPDPAAEAPPARPQRQPSPGQLAARERLRACGAEWRTLRAERRTEGQRWLDFRRSCLARLKSQRDAATPRPDGVSAPAG